MKSNEGETTLKHPESFHGNVKNLSKRMKMKNKGELHINTRAIGLNIRLPHSKKSSFLLLERHPEDILVAQ